MSLLRSRLFALIVALLVGGGFSERVLGSCEHAAAAHTEQPCDSQHTDSDTQHACDCFCHATLIDEAPRSLAVGFANVPVGALKEWAEFPPDPIPLRIEHPPQLG